MPLYLLEGDITGVRADAIVNAANPSLMGGGGVDGAIHRAAGPALREACAALGGCRPGEAKITPGFRLPARYVIHTVGPVWHGGDAGERAVLASCYRNSLDLAEAHGCASVAFPLISAGAYGYPEAEAVNVALETVRDWLTLRDSDMDVRLVLFRKPANPRLGELTAILFPRPSAAKNAPAGSAPSLRPSRKAKTPMLSLLGRKSSAVQEESAAFREDAPCGAPADAAVPLAFESGLSFDPKTLDEAVKMADESFSEMLLRKIDERGMKDSECYRRANVDRKLFSKIRSDPHYRPSKPTVLAFAIALELSLEETTEMLLKAGYALSPSTTFDLIIRYFISHGNYNLFEINEALFAFDQNQLGA